MNPIRPLKRFVNLAVAAVLLVVSPAAGFGCGVNAQGALSNAPASVKQVTATMDDSNSLIFHIQGSVQAAGNVTVKYWSNGTGPFMTAPVPTRGAAFSVEVMRLRPSTQYNYQVFLSSPSSTPVSQYQGTFTTGPLPAGLQHASIKLIQGTPTYDLTLMDFNNTGFSGIVITDKDGNIVWYYQHDKQVFTIAQRDNYNLVFNELAQVVGYSMYEIAPDGGKIFSVDDTLMNGELCQPYGRWHHEILLRPDGKVWTLGEEIRSVNVNGNDTLQTGCTIEEWDETSGTVTRLVSLFDLLDPVTDRTQDSDVTTGFFWKGSQDQYANETQDWSHGNSLSILPDGNILMSIRHLNQIIAIKPDFSGIAWTLGGVGSDFTFPDPSDQFYHQHYARMLPNGNILLFDNGNLRPEAEGGQYSRGLELKLDFNMKQAAKVWEYRNKPDLYSSAVGSAVRLDNGNTVLDFGVADSQNPNIYNVVEADPAGNAVAVFQISAPGKTIQYRAIPIGSISGETPAQP